MLKDRSSIGRPGVAAPPTPQEDDAPPTPPADFSARKRLNKSAGHTVRLAAFVTGCALSGFVLGAGSLLLAYLLHSHRLFCGGMSPCWDAGPYIAVVPFAGVIRAIILLRRRAWDTRRTHGYFEEVAEALRDAALGSLVIIVFTFFFRSGNHFRGFSYSRLVFVYDWILASGLALALAVATKSLLIWLRRKGHNERTVVVVKARGIERQIGEFIDSCPELGYRLLGTVEVDPSFGARDQAHMQEELLRIARAQRLDEVILVVPRIDRQTLSNLVGVAELVNLEVKALPEFFGLPPRKVNIEKLGTLPMLSLLEEPLPGGRRALKRAVDLIGSSILILLSAPVMALAALFIRLTSEGPVLLRQIRIGMDGRPFRLFKFRTMINNADSSPHKEYVQDLISGNVGEPTGSDEAFFKLEEDPRVTRVGRILRRMSLDELPQLFNVFLGDMSLVGPRPPLPFEVSLYKDWHKRRLEVRPGMTGLWQVSGRSKIGFDDMVRLDIEYLEHWSPLTDLLILGRTVPALLRKETS